MFDFWEALSILGPFSSTGLSGTFLVIVPWAAVVQDWALGAGVSPAPAPFRAPGRQRAKLPEYRGSQSWELVGSSKEKRTKTKFSQMEEGGEVEGWQDNI